MKIVKTIFFITAVAVAMVSCQKVTAPIETESQTDEYSICVDGNSMTKSITSKSINIIRDGNGNIIVTLLKNGTSNGVEQENVNWAFSIPNISVIGIGNKTGATNTSSTGVFQSSDDVTKLYITPIAVGTAHLKIKATYDGKERAVIEDFPIVITRSDIKKLEILNGSPIKGIEFDVKIKATYYDGTVLTPEESNFLFDCCKLDIVKGNNFTLSSQEQIDKDDPMRKFYIMIKRDNEGRTLLGKTTLRATYNDGKTVLTTSKEFTVYTLMKVHILAENIVDTKNNMTTGKKFTLSLKEKDSDNKLFNDGLYITDYNESYKLELGALAPELINYTQNGETPIPYTSSLSSNWVKNGSTWSWNVTPGNSRFLTFSANSSATLDVDWSDGIIDILIPGRDFFTRIPKFKNSTEGTVNCRTSDQDDSFQQQDADEINCGNYVVYEQKESTLSNDRGLHISFNYIPN